MFSVKQKREISDKIQKILRETNHPELPSGEIQFHLHVNGAESWSWADIKNNGAVENPSINPFNELQDNSHKEQAEVLHSGGRVFKVIDDELHLDNKPAGIFTSTAEDMKKDFPHFSNLKIFIGIVEYMNASFNLTDKEALQLIDILKLDEFTKMSSSTLMKVWSKVTEGNADEYKSE